VRWRIPICRVSEVHAMQAMTGVLDELRECILEANAADTPLRLRGAGTKDFYGEQLEGAVLDVSRYQGIVHYEPSELVLTARCGTPLSQVETALAAQGQFLAFEPPRCGADPTLGGAIAAGLSGPGRTYLGAARDFVLGAHLLNAQGEVLRFGGEVMKNVAGFDVARLLCGSLGILGCITQVSLKVLPLPRAQATLRLEWPVADALRQFNRLAGEPLPLSGAAWQEGAAWLRLAGAAPAVAAACKRIGGEQIDEPRARAFWSALRDLTLPFFAQEPLWRVSVASTAPELALEGPVIIDWGGALRWYAGLPLSAGVRAVASAAGGTAALFRGPTPADAPRFHPLADVNLALHRRLKERFDPKGIFNRNRLIKDL
jgi:glycolate oxidase FAD binding subunit